MKLGSLCSGAGGLDMAVEQVFGVETVWHCEINDAASQVLEYRYPGVPNHRDLTTTDWDSVEPVDILTGGYPCQPFSHAGQRKGTDDERHIWPSVREAICRVRPRFAILENVAGHRSLGFDRVLGDLAEDGMHVRWTSLRAADVGACHGRERLFILVTPNSSDGTGHGEWARPQLGQGDTSSADTGDGVEPEWARAARREGGQRSPVGPVSRRGGDIALMPTPVVTDAAGARNATAGRRNPLSSHHSGETLTDAISLLPTPNASDGSGGGQHPDKRVGHSRQLIDYVLLQTPSVADALGGHLSRSGARADEPLLPGQAREMDGGWGKYADAIARWEAVTRPAPSPTEPNRNGKPRLNPEFSEWMMGWPPGWVTGVPGISRNDQLRIIGNGVVPQCASAALSWLLSLDCEVAA